MVKQIKLPDPYEFPDELQLEPYVADPLCDVIQRAIEQGVSPVATVSLSYDDEGSDLIDPSSDIRTDRFLLAEMAEQQRSAAKAMSEAAQASVVDPAPAPSPTPEPVPVDPAK